MPTSTSPSPDADDAPSRASALMGGRLRVLQPERGYRAGLDAGLLAAAVDGRPGERILEAGCGVGAALMQAALRAPETRFVGIERDPSALALARRNLEANDLAVRVAVQAGDVAVTPWRGAQPPFDAAFANPPFFDDPSALRGPAPERRGAWLSDAGLSVWIAFLIAAVRDTGRIVLIHRADRLGDILAALAPRAGSMRVRPIHPFADRAAKRVMVRAVRAGRAPLVLLPPLIVHEAVAGTTPGFTREAEAILRGEASLGWGDDQSA